MNIYVKNIPPNLCNDDLRKFFEVFGKVISAEIITNVRTGELKDYAFVVMGSEQEAQDVITALDGKEWMGQIIRLEKGRNRNRRGRKEPRRPYSDRRA